jgi:hypothetical protein
MSKQLASLTTAEMDGFFQRLWTTAKKTVMRSSMVATALTPLVALSPAKAQGMQYTINVSSPANGISETLALNSLDSVPANGNNSSLAGYTFANGTVNQIENGVSSSDQGVILTAFQDGPVQTVFATWGFNSNDGILFDYASGTIPNMASLPNVMGALQDATPLPDYPQGNLITYDASLSNSAGITVPATTFSVEAIAVPGPILSVGFTGGTMKVFWPTNAVGFQLQTSKLLGTNWTTITNQPANVGTNYLLTFPATNTAEFFRLCSTNN